MNTRYRRRARVSLLNSALRLVAFLAAFGTLVAAWTGVRPLALHHLACANLGNPRTKNLIARAILEKHPDIDPLSRTYPRQSYVESFDTGRIRSAIVEAGGRIHVFDDRLDKLASIANPGFVVCAPDDANGDGRLELLLEVHRGGVSDDPGLFALIQLGQQQYLLVAAFLSSEAYGDGWYEQYWIDAPSARRCDLAFVRSTAMPSGVLVPQSKLVFHWNEDGILTGDDPALAKFKCWLADSKGPIPCNPDQPLIDIVETALWRPEKLRR